VSAPERKNTLGEKANFEDKNTTFVLICENRVVAHVIYWLIAVTESCEGLATSGRVNYVSDWTHVSPSGVDSDVQPGDGVGKEIFRW